MIRSIRIYLITKFVSMVPETRLFRLKTRLYRWAGFALGKGVQICSSAQIIGGGSLTIGDQTWIGHQTLIVCSGNVTIGANVDIGPRVYVGTGSHHIDESGPRSAGEGYNEDVIIDSGAWLGAGSIILPGVRIGEKAVVAAGAVVTRDIEPNTLVAGVPARIIRRW